MISVSRPNGTNDLHSLRVAMLSLHSSPRGDLGTRDTGGMSVVVGSLARNLGAAGHHVDIFTCMGDMASGGDFGTNVRLVHLWKDGQGLTKTRLPGEIERIFERMEAYRRNVRVCYDIIHSHYWISGLLGARARERWGSPHLTMFHTLGLMKNKFAPGENEPQRRLSAERRLVATVDRIIAPTQEERDQLMRHYQADPATISVVPYGVHIDGFQTEPRISARRGLNLPIAARVLLFVGRFVPLKGLDRLIDALALLKPRQPDIELVLVGGDGPGADSTRNLQRRAARLNLDQHIHFAGRVPHHALGRYYAAADALVLPSQYESFGLVVPEALACGLPVAATPVGAANRLIRNGFNGILFDGVEARDMAVGLDRLLAMLAEGRLGRDNIRSSVAHMTWHRVWRADRKRSITPCWKPMVSGNPVLSNSSGCTASC